MHTRLVRLGALIHKEMIQLLRERRTLFLILTIPLIELFLFGYAVDLTVDHLPTVVADMSLDAQSRDFIRALEVSGYFDMEAYVESEAEVIRAIDKGKAKAGVLIPPNFAAQVGRGNAQVLMVFDGADSLSVQSGYGAASAIAQAYATELVVQRVRRMGWTLDLPASVGTLTGGGAAPISSSIRVLYNPNMADLIFLVPGTAALLLQVMTVSLTAQAVVREQEMGTMEQILATPVRPLELIVSKMVPNLLLAAVNLLSIIAFGVFWFGVPFAGNVWLFGLLSTLFILSGLGMGLLVSTMASTQKEAQQITGLLMVFYQLLTGFIYPRAPMPPVIRAIGNLLPVTYYIRIARGIMTKGIGIAFLWGDVLALVLYGTVVMTLAALTFRRRLG